MNRRLAIAVAGAALLVTAAPPTGAAAAVKAETAGAGPVSATFSYRPTSDFAYADMTLKIVRDGVVALDGPIASPDCEYGCAPLGPIRERGSSIRVTDLDGDGEPEVIVDLFTGGAHCCVVTQIFALQSAAGAPAYSRDEHNFLDPGYSLTDLDDDGRTEFRSADGRFAYAISSYVGSGLPVQVWRFQGGALVDVTGEFRDLVGADARHWWHRYRKYAPRRPPYNDPGLGALAAWAADEYRLGHGRKVQREIRRAFRRGWLDSIFASDRRTVRSLNGLLADAGYR